MTDFKGKLNQHWEEEPALGNRDDRLPIPIKRGLSPFSIELAGKRQNSLNCPDDSYTTNKVRHGFFYSLQPYQRACFDV